MLLDTAIPFGRPAPKAKLGARVACWLVVLDEERKITVVRRQGTIIGLFGRHSVKIQDEVLEGIEEPVFVHRSMLFLPADGGPEYKNAKKS